VFRDYLGYSVKHVGGPGDQGVDLLLSESESPIAIQVKRRMHAKPAELVRVVRDLIGSMILGGILRGIVVSTAENFSKPAKDAVQSVSLERNKLELELVGYNELIDRVRVVSIPERPWNNFDYMGPDVSG
jgi:HJR/Mrr/RecB family endonuclease